METAGDGVMETGNVRVERVARDGGVVATVTVDHARRANSMNSALLRLLPPPWASWRRMTRCVRWC